MSDTESAAESPEPESTVGQQIVASEAIAASASRRNRDDMQHIVLHTPKQHWRRLAVLGWFCCAVALFFLITQAISYRDYFDTTEGLEERFHSGNQTGTNKVAVLSIEGAIIDGSGYVKQQIDRIKKDPNIKAVVVRVVSPGGTISGSDYIFHHLKKLREEKKIPIVVSMGGIAASGGYYVAMAVGDQENTIFAEPTTITGSIGVIIPHYDISGLLNRYDVKDDSIVSHPRKQMLSMTRPISDEHRVLLQAQVNDAFNRFKEIVKEGRPAFEKDTARLNELATGEVFTANTAKDLGLVDKIGFVEEAIARAIDLAALNQDSVRVVRYKKPASLFEIPGFVSASQRGQLDVASLFELSSPRCYYLATTLPPLVSSRDFCE